MSLSGIKILFAGSGAFAVPTLQRLIESGAEVLRVFSQPDRPAGRGKKLTPTPVASLAIEKNLDLVRTDNLNAQPLPDADILIVIAFGQKIAPAVVNHPAWGSINLHASILPKYRGAAPIHWARMMGERITGNSIIRLADKMDAGAVLDHSELVIGENETTGELHDRLAQDGAALVERVLQSLKNGTQTEREQDHTKATIAPKLNREHSIINWNQPAQRIVDQIHGLYPWPGCRVRLIDDHECEITRLTLVRARVITQPRDGFVGIIDEHARIGAADHMIEVLEVQPEGKRPMSLKQFRNGHRWDAEMRLESIA